jgi:hypothetical protein
MQKKDNMRGLRGVRSVRVIFFMLCHRRKSQTNEHCFVQRVKVHEWDVLYVR